MGGGCIIDSLLQKQFLVSIGNRFLVPTIKSDTLCMIKNGSFFVLSDVDRFFISVVIT
jgi:hypothetical protein